MLADNPNGPPIVEEYGVFLNIPYDRAFEPLYLAYIAGLSAFRLAPRATPQIPGGERRLDRILDLIRDCRYSIHDLSRARGWRAGKSLSDLSGTDVYAHGGTPAGVFRKLCNALVLADHQPGVAQMAMIYRKLRRGLPNLIKSTGAKSAFKARVFADLIVVAKGLASEPAG